MFDENESLDCGELADEASLEDAFFLRDAIPTAAPWAEMNRPFGTGDKKAETGILSE